MPHIIAFYSPRPGMGKSTAAAFAEGVLNEHSGRITAYDSFAWPIKRAACTIFNLDPYAPETDAMNKDKPLKDFAFTFRDVLVKIGQGLKELDVDIWVKIMDKVLDANGHRGDSTLIDDLRFPQEYEMLRQRGAKMIRIWKPGQSIAPTETEGLLEGYEFDAEIINGGSLEEFKERVVETVEKLLIKGKTT